MSLKFSATTVSASSANGASETAVRTNDAGAGPVGAGGSWGVFGQAPGVGCLPSANEGLGAAEGSSLSLQEAIRYLAENQVYDDAGGRNSFLGTYMDLINLYEQKCERLYEATETACKRLVVESKVPEVIDADPRQDESDLSEMDRLAREVKRKFADAMRRVQYRPAPKRRRGNLPKTATAAFKKWFGEHYENPYPSEEEKAALSKMTGVSTSQITNWFINHRKRVWKPATRRGTLRQHSPVTLGLRFDDQSRDQRPTKFSRLSA